MSSTNRRQTIHVRSDTTTTTTPVQHPYFLIIMTNYPDLLQRTREYQPLPAQYWQQQQQQHPGGAGGGIFIPGVRVHFGATHTENHERLLYNTLRYQLEDIIRTYLRLTHQLYPIYLVFDMSHINSQL